MLFPLTRPHPAEIGHWPYFTALSGLTCAGGRPASSSLALLFSSLGSSPAYLLCAWPTREQGNACISPRTEAAQMGKSTRAFAWPQTCCVTQGSCFTSLSLSFLVYTMVSHPCVHIAILNCDKGRVRAWEGTQSGRQMALD